MMTTASIANLESRNVRRTRRVCAFTALLPCGLGDVVEVTLDVANDNSISVIEQVVDQFGKCSSQVKTIEAIASGEELLISASDAAASEAQYAHAAVPQFSDGSQLYVVSLYGVYEGQTVSATQVVAVAEIAAMLLPTRASNDFEASLPDAESDISLH